MLIFNRILNVVFSSILQVSTEDDDNRMGWHLSSRESILAGFQGFIAGLAKPPGKNHAEKTFLRRTERPCNHYGYRGGLEMTPGFEIARGNSRSIRPFMNIPVCKGVSRLSRRLPTTHCSGNPMPKLLCRSRECTPFLNESPGLVIGPMCSKGLVLVEHFGFAKTEGKSLLKMAAILSLLKNLLQDRTLSTG